MIALTPHRILHRLAVTAALVLYALPLSIGTFSQLSHGAYHVLDRLEALQARAAALGMVHLGALDVGRAAFTHTHDGVTHSHAGPVDALLSASERTEDEQDAAAPLSKLSAHTLATTTPLWIALSSRRPSRSVDPAASEQPRPLPPLPPPRG